jgi:hypothetical protein
MRALAWCVIDQGVRFRAGVEEFLDQRQRICGNHPGEVRRRFHVSSIHGPKQRREALRIRLVHVRLAVDEKRRHLVVAVEDGPSASFPSPSPIGSRDEIGPSADIDTVFKKDFDRDGTFRSGPHQGGGPAPSLLRVDVDSTLQQKGRSLRSRPSRFSSEPSSG